MDNRGLFLYKNTIRENRIRDEFNNLRRLCAAARKNLIQCGTEGGAVSLLQSALLKTVPWVEVAHGI